MEQYQLQNTAIEERVSATLARLTLEQKCCLLSGKTAFTTRDYPSLGVPELQFSDGPCGLRYQKRDANNLGIGSSEPATCFPAAVTLAQTWNPALMQAVGAALGEEAASLGVDVLLAPGINIKRHPLCGRNFEYLSEDPYLAGKLASGYVMGVQSKSVGACVKHFAANSQETRRAASNSVVDERALREIYLRAFEIVLREAANTSVNASEDTDAAQKGNMAAYRMPAALMTSYNQINGTYANENEELLRTILREEWGYTGAVISDWGGSNSHVAAVQAGSTLQMPGCGFDSVRELIKAVKQGKLAESTLDARVSELLRLVFTYHHKAQDNNTTSVLNAAGTASTLDAHHQLARVAAAEGMVLLKNQTVELTGLQRVYDEHPAQDNWNSAHNHQPLLPLAPQTTVALIGDFAAHPRYQGAGSSEVNPTQISSLLEAIQNSPLRCIGYEQGFLRHEGIVPGDKYSAIASDAAAQKKDSELREKAVELAQKASVAIVCLGLDEAAEAEGQDRSTYHLSKNQLACLKAIADTQTPVVVVLSCGGAVQTGWSKYAQAILYTGLAGQASAEATLDILCGVQNPSAKLAETWPRYVEDVPCNEDYPSHKPHSFYKESIYVGYRYYQKTELSVAYHFGFGLSYTQFAYSDPALSEDGRTVSFTLTNVGAVAGAEVAQVYVAKPNTRIFRPARELKGFAKVWLEPGASERVQITLDTRSYQYFNVKTHAWETEGGLYAILIGGSSQDLPLSIRYNAPSSKAAHPYEGLKIPSYESGQVRGVSNDEFTQLIGSELPPQRIMSNENLCVCDFDHTASLILRGVRTYVKRKTRVLRADGKPDVNALFIYNMPLRMLAKSTDGVLSAGFVRAVVREAQGWGIGGTIAAIGCSFFTGWLAWFVWLLWMTVPFAWELVVNALQNARMERVLITQDRAQDRAQDKVQTKVQAQAKLSPQDTNLEKTQAKTELNHE